jgi:FAD/FMN-containing dehydrogenase
MFPLSSYLTIILIPILFSFASSCSQNHGLQIRIRSGGHDYEGLSYVSEVPFVVIDLIDFRAIEINVESRTAWVQTGATIGELYYAISRKSRNLGFPAGICPTVGVGGHFSGGGLVAVDSCCVNTVLQRITSLMLT